MTSQLETSSFVVTGRFKSLDLRVNTPEGYLQVIVGEDKLLPESCKYPSGKMANVFGKNNKTPVTLLQELLMKKHMMPNFQLILNGVGTHEPIFKYEVTANNSMAIGTGKSKKEAKHDAANKLLMILKKEDEDIAKEPIDLEATVQSPYESIIKVNAVGSLTDFCLSKSLSLPEYKLTRDEGLPHAKIFCMSCSVSSFTTEATARTKKQAKQLAAQNMLDKLNSVCSSNFPAEAKTDNTDQIDASTDEVLKELEKRNLTKAKPVTHEHLGVKITNYCCILKEDPIVSKSQTLESLHSMSDDTVKTLENPDELLKEIFEEIQYEFELLEHDLVRNGQVVYVLLIKSSPNWTIMGTGQTKDKALREVYYRTLKFLKTMSK